jgi:hypothetical protein
MLYDIINHGNLRLDSEDSLYDFINKGTETNREMCSLLELVRFKYCSTDIMDDFLDLLSQHVYGINASVWANFRARLVLPNLTRKQFPPSVKKGRRFDVPSGIIAHLTRECGRNVHDCYVVDVTSGSFEKETRGANPQSGVYRSRSDNAASNAADMETDSCFCSARRTKEEDIPHTRNNWICYDFKNKWIVPTHYAIRTYGGWPGNYHLKSWLVETSTDGESWREVAREEDNEQLNGRHFTGTFAVAGGGQCHFIRLVNIGRNYLRDDRILISAWEIFGSLLE